MRGPQRVALGSCTRLVLAVDEGASERDGIGRKNK